MKVLVQEVKIEQVNIQNAPMKWKRLQDKRRISCATIKMTFNNTFSIKLLKEILIRNGFEPLIFTHHFFIKFEVQIVVRSSRCHFSFRRVRNYLHNQHFIQTTS